MFLIKKYHFFTVDFVLVLSCSLFSNDMWWIHFPVNIKLEPTTTSSPRRRGRGLHTPVLPHDQIQCFWLAEVRNFSNIMIECVSLVDHSWASGWVRKFHTLTQSLCRSLTAGIWLPSGLSKGTVTGVWKTVGIPRVTWAHNAMAHWAIPVYI